MDDKYKFRSDLREFFPGFIEALSEIRSDFASVSLIEEKIKAGSSLSRWKPKHIKTLISECFVLCGWKSYSHNKYSGKTYSRGYLTLEEFEKLESWSIYKLPKEKMLRNS